MHRGGRDAQHADHGTLDAGDAPALAVDHRELLVAPGMGQAGLAQGQRQRTQCSGRLPQQAPGRAARMLCF